MAMLYVSYDLHKAAQALPCPPPESNKKNMDDDGNQITIPSCYEGDTL